VVPFEAGYSRVSVAGLQHILRKTYCRQERVPDRLLVNAWKGWGQSPIERINSTFVLDGLSRSAHFRVSLDDVWINRICVLLDSTCLMGHLSLTEFFRKNR
jgi:hypothetical protein